MSYEKLIAEAMRDAVVSASFIKQGRYSSGVGFRIVDIDAIIASIPRPEPVAYRFYKEKFACWEYDEPDNRTAGQNAEPLYAAPVSAEPVNARLVDLLTEIRPNYGAVGSRDVDIARQQKIIDEALSILTAAEQAKPAPEYCNWTPDRDQENMPDTWNGSCGAVWTFMNDGPKENSMRFCPECGKPLRELRGEGK